MLHERTAAVGIFQVLPVGYLTTRYGGRGVESVLVTAPQLAGVQLCLEAPGRSTAGTTAHCGKNDDGARCQHNAHHNVQLESWAVPGCEKE